MGLGLVHTFRVGTTQVGLDFNSLCKLDDGTILGANSIGIYTLDSQETDDGEDIFAWCEFPRTDFGFSQQKRIDKLIVSFEASGNQSIEVRDDEGNWIARSLEPFADSQKSEGMVVPVGRALSGRHFGIRWENVAGSDFSIDAIDAKLTLRQKRAGRSAFFSPYLAQKLPKLYALAGDLPLQDFRDWDDLFMPADSVTISMWSVDCIDFDSTDSYWDYAYTHAESFNDFTWRFIINIQKAADDAGLGLYVYSDAGDQPFLDIYESGGVPVVRVAEYIVGHSQSNSAEYSLLYNVEYLFVWERTNTQNILDIYLVSTGALVHHIEHDIIEVAPFLYNGIYFASTADGLVSCYIRDSFFEPGI
jgi:hypothetical protein